MNYFKIQMHKFFLKKFLQSLLKVKRILLPNFHLAKMPLLGAFFTYLISMLQSNYVDDMQGHKMYLDEKDTLYLSLDRMYEPLETMFFQNEVNKGDVALDIGANIGYYTLLFAKQVGLDGHVFAFEPEPENFALLSKNVGINAYTNVTLVNKAVSENTGKLKLFVSEDNKGDHRTYDSHDGREAIEVDSIRLDDYFANFSEEVNFIKMDIQGAEYYAVQGMTSLLQKNPRIVLMTEFEPISLLRSGAEPRAYLELLLDIGFTIYDINENKNNQRIERTDIQHLLKAYTAKSGRHTNLVCRKRDFSPEKRRVTRRQTL